MAEPRSAPRPKHLDAAGRKRWGERHSQDRSLWLIRAGLDPEVCRVGTETCPECPSDLRLGPSYPLAGREGDLGLTPLGHTALLLADSPEMASLADSGDPC